MRYESDVKWNYMVDEIYAQMKRIALNMNAWFEEYQINVKWKFISGRMLHIARLRYVVLSAIHVISKVTTVITN